MAFAGLENTTGTKIYVSAAEPATFDVAGYQALDYTQIVGVVTFGEWGNTEADVSEPLLAEDQVIHTNGIADGGEVSISIQKRDTDAGADIISTAGGTNDLVTILKVYASGESEVAVGIVTSPKQRAAAGDAIRGYTVMARINTALTEMTSAETTAALA